MMGRGERDAGVENGGMKGVVYSLVAREARNPGAETQGGDSTR